MKEYLLRHSFSSKVYIIIIAYNYLNIFKKIQIIKDGQIANLKQCIEEHKINETICYETAKGTSTFVVFLIKSYICRICLLF